MRLLTQFQLKISVTKTQSSANFLLLDNSLFSDLFTEAK